MTSLDTNRAELEPPDAVDGLRKAVSWFMPAVLVGIAVVVTLVILVNIVS